ncbi:MAG TPA: FAD-dependent oxidoreductase [Gaiellaceae bacterium]|nr:FAD-dependent oxidoreductase [Gaiellaceae bacterium]
MTRVAVVGAGVMGCAAAWALAERGADVTVLEQFDLDHVRGSSHGRTRIVRLAYPAPHWVRLAAEAMAGWRELEAASGQQLLGLYGLVELVPGSGATSAAALEACDVEYRALDTAGARALGAVLPPGWAALFQPDAGIVRADLARRAFLDIATSRGARVETGHRVRAVDDVDADVVVVTAGPWATRLVAGLPVRVTRETFAYYRREGPPPPAIVDLSPETGGHAMYALYDPVHGLKAGAHGSGAEADPDEDGTPDPEIVDRISAWVGERLAGVEPVPAAAETCFYTSTVDEAFVLERRGCVVVCSACSGHGFKFAPAVGRRLADLALE